MILERWQRWLLGIAAVLAGLYIVFVVNELGGVNIPVPERVRDEHLIRLSRHQGWPEGWEVGQSDWFHHASQGTRILPYDWFVNLEKPTLVPSGKMIDQGYLERFGFLASRRDPSLNPAGLPIGFAIEPDFHADYACPPSSGNVVGLTCAACHTGQLTYRDGSGTLKGIRIEGGSAMINLAAFQAAIGRALAFTLQFDARFERFAKNVLGTRATAEQTSKLKASLKTFLDVGMASKEYARVHKLNGTEGGFARTDALGLIGNRVFVALGNENLTVPDAPVNFPPLWDTAWFDWVQYNASIRMPMVRNIGEALGVGAAVNLDERNGELYASTVNVENLHLLEEQLGGRNELLGLQSPRWVDTELPALEQARVVRGAGLYKHYCQECHLPPVDELRADVRNGFAKTKEFWAVDPQSSKRFLKLKTIDLYEIGTDQNQAMNFYRRVAIFRGESVPAARGLFAVTEFIRRASYDKLRLGPSQVEEYNRFRKFDEGTQGDVESGKFMKEVLVANLRYKARPLDGIWATPPYLHNGSVPNLYQLLSPASERDRVFYLGTTLYDPKHVGYVSDQFEGAFRLDTSLPGNSNAGHEFRNLTLEELETAASPPPCVADQDDRLPTPAEINSRWARVLNVPRDQLPGLSPADLWEKKRQATREALSRERVKREHTFKGIIGPELSEAERWDLVEYLKSM